MNEVDELLLEHFGTKGMKWGSRKGAGVKTTKTPKTKEEKHTRNKKIAIGVGVGVGVLAAGALLAKNRNVKIKNLGIQQKNMAEINKLMSAHNKVKVSEVSAGHKLFMEEINTKQKRLTSAANQHLRSLYNDNDTPIHARDYVGG